MVFIKDFEKTAIRNCKIKVLIRNDKLNIDKTKQKLFEKVLQQIYISLFDNEALITLFFILFKFIFKRGKNHLLKKNHQREQLVFDSIAL